MRQKRNDLSWQIVLDRLRRRLVGSGIDLLHPFSAGNYNLAVEDLHKLPAFESASSLGILVANSRVLWPVFIDSLSANPDLSRAPHPLDQYVKEQVLKAIGDLPCRSEVRWEYDPPPLQVPIQKIAEFAGFARISASHLSIHPLFGPWVSLRAVLVIDIDGPEEELQPLNDECNTCETRCEVLLKAALATARKFESTAVAQNWRSWLKVREACSVGAGYRFSDEQILYHYTKDRRFLEPSSMIETPDNVTKS